MKQVYPTLTYLLVLFVLLVTASALVEAQKCKPSGKVKGKKPLKNQCNQDNGAECCEQGKFYTTYKCSPPVSTHTKEILTINSFEEGGDGGGPSECDGWFGNKKRCRHHITINGNGRSVKALVVDHCDSTMGCDGEHGYQPSCPNNIVDASKAVWKALGVNEKDKEWGWMDVTWSDA
ncbi:hypothetical protein POTOM_013942 [Populus tomentosa]|uniref:Ripening-related protein 1 n=1 Tax=Populus tomentosa TaxID=118781 RepID=A0A8X8A5R6_POPTO|nr:hypothetical protein POTOM_013942 [Populus tomentosa]